MAQIVHLGPFRLAETSCWNVMTHCVSIVIENIPSAWKRSGLLVFAVIALSIYLQPKEAKLQAQILQLHFIHKRMPNPGLNLIVSKSSYHCLSLLITYQSEAVIVKLFKLFIHTYAFSLVWQPPSFLVGQNCFDVFCCKQFWVVGRERDREREGSYRERERDK